MTKCTLFFCSLLCVCISITAQSLPNDIIITMGREQIHVKVLKVGIDEVEYLKADNLDGPVYTIAKKDIISIHYVNGGMEVFNEAANDTQPRSKPAIETQTAETPVGEASVAEKNPQASRYAPKDITVPLMTYHNGYFLDGMPLSRQEAQHMIYTASYQGVHYWKKARRNSGWGWTLAALGTLEMVSAGVMFASGNAWSSLINQSPDGTTTFSFGHNGTTALIQGVAFITGAAVCLSRVKPARKMAAKSYNDAIQERHRASIQLVPASEGIGLALRF